ncbi:thioredoxin domain-containing protein [Candidatus Uhrbacteria bacterium]|nr:thioredoxin domain-containing protein [Candidatus Uhrbacteria bacterium]
MRHPWLILLTLTFLTALVFGFYLLDLRPIPRPTPFEPVAPGSLLTPSVSIANPSLGNPAAKVTLVEFSDFECDACRGSVDAIKLLLKKYPDDVRYVWKNLPNDETHPLATKAAIAAHCAGAQGAFFPYHDALFKQGTLLTEQTLIEIAASLNLNQEKFTACYQKEDPLPLIRRDIDEAIGLGLVASPTFFIGEQRIVGEQTIDDLIPYVEQALKK